MSNNFKQGQGQLAGITQIIQQRLCLRLDASKGDDH